MRFKIVLEDNAHNVLSEQETDDLGEAIEIFDALRGAHRTGFAFIADTSTDRNFVFRWDRMDGHPTSVKDAPHYRPR